MKKISMFMMGAAAIALAACNGNKAEGAAAAADSVATDAVETVDSMATQAADATSGDPIDKYAELVDKVLDLTKKAKSGDATATTESQNLAQEMAKLVQSPEFQESIKNPDNQKKYMEIAKKYTDAAQNMMK